ncbi:MAG: hypothetical protein RLZZ502_681, partial [Pseudomonadota bacterium]
MSAATELAKASSLSLGLGVTVLQNGLASQGIDGIGHYTEALLSQLRARPELDLHLFQHQRQLTCSYAGQPVTPLGHYPHRVAPAAYLGVNFPEAALRQQGVQLFHAPDHIIPRFRHTPVVATVMDAIPLSHPEWTRQHFTQVKNSLWRRMVRTAAHVITISQFSKAEIVHYFGVRPENITVTYLGADLPTPLEQRESTQALLQKYHLDKPYFLILGTLQPRKNIARCIQAYLSLPAHLRDGVDLVIAGKSGWPDQDTHTALNKGLSSGQVKYLGYVSANDKQMLLQHAFCLLFMSLSEGFGLPVLEAFAA